MILNLSESLAKPLVMAKLNMAYLSSSKNRAKLLSSSLPVSPSRVLRAPGTSQYHLYQNTSYTKNRNFYRVPNLQTFASGAALWLFKKPSKTAVVLIAGVTISGTPCLRHITVLFGAESPSGHVAQAWVIPPPSCSPNGTDNRRQCQRQW